MVPMKAKTVSTADSAASVARIGGGIRFIGCLLLLIAIAALSTLSYAKLNGRSAPGCGPGSDCDLATQGAWGAIPGIGWPLSHVGVAYFVALLVAWLSSAAISAGFRNLVRFGGLVSLLYTVVLIASALSCKYCLAAHAANFLFWIVVEWRTRAVALPSRSMAPWLGTFAIVTLTLGIAEISTRRAAAARAVQAAAESTDAILAHAANQAASQASTAAALAESQPANANPPPRASSPGRRAFTGRYRRGPEKAPIRIVACSDFQCAACKQVDAELHDIFQSRHDVSISMKNFPMCLDCNKYAGKTMHANACWAARAGEAAGLLKGDDGFWAMHDALFARSGNFLNQDQLRDMVVPLGFDFAEFERTMKSEETMALVKADVEECMGIGMRYTPMVLINGVEFRGWEKTGAIKAAVEKLAATNPPALSADADVVPGAAERLAGLWKDEPLREIPSLVWRHTLGPADAKLQVALFGDFQEPSVARADAYLRQQASARADLRYAFAHYPVGKDCNPNIPKSIHPQGCWAAGIAEAAAKIAGEEGYWRMHAWLLAHQATLTDAALDAAEVEHGLSADSLRAAAGTPEVRDAIRAQIDAGKQLGLTSIPWIFVNGRLVPVWEYTGENLLPRILDSAAGEAK
jgi:protein-disulfide isomerase/uncharacterized membrane protein